MHDSLLGVTSAAFGAWPMLEPYAVSLSRSGFSGHRVMFTQGLPDESMRNLQTLGFELIEFSDPIRSYEHFWYLRASLVKQYLETHPTRYALLLDCRDLIFQGNVSEWLERNLSPYTLVACSECVPISFSSRNIQWISEAFGRQEWLDSYPVLCGGTFGGEAGAFIELLDSICGILKDERATDQAALNYFCRMSPFKDIVKVPKMSEGFTCTCCHVAGYPVQLARSRPMLLEAEPVFRDGLVYPAGGEKPFCIVHEYDLNPAWDSVIRGEYRL
jgi:hypothetical protein